MPNLVKYPLPIMLGPEKMNERKKDWAFSEKIAVNRGN